MGFNGASWLSGSTGDFNALSALLSGLAVKENSTATEGTISVPTSAWVTISSATIETKADDHIIWGVNFSYSAGDVASNGQVRLTVDNNPKDLAYPIHDWTGLTNGLSTPCCLITGIQGLDAGIHTFRFQAQLFGGPQPIYIGKSYQWYFRQKNQ